VIEVTGSNNLWQVRYPAPADGRLAKHVHDVRNIHVPLGTQVILALSSQDYVYTLAIPDYGLKEIAVPEHEFRMEFRPRAAGRLELVGEHFCGDPFSGISGHLVIEPQDRFLAWLHK
jgi:heme/copper-type cytochrome/quinol oxidase subunit 2